MSDVQPCLCDPGDERARRRLKTMLLSTNQWWGGRVRKVTREARSVGAERFFLAGGPNVELGMISEAEEFAGMYGPFCWTARS